MAAGKVECGVTNCGRDVHTLRARLLLYFRTDRLEPADNKEVISV
jgi:hypothetical protein